jgi:hypothetical protein
MPDMYFTGSGAIQLGAATQLCTLALETASAPRIVLNYLNISFDGNSNTAVPVNCVIARITNSPSGTAIPTNYGPNPLDPSAPASTVTAKCPSTATPGVWSTAPTLGSIVWEMDIPPTTGIPNWWPLAAEVKVGASSWVGVFLTAPAAVAVKTSLYHTE